MNSINPIILSLAAVVLSGCQILTKPNQAETHQTFVQSIEFASHRAQLQSDLLQLVSPLNQREEQGVLRVTLTGGNLDKQEQALLKQKLEQTLLLPVQWHYRTSAQAAIQGQVTILFQPNTCRYSTSSEPISRQACQVLRNQYASLVSPTTWQQGDEYQEGNSALSTGAIQRLHDNQIKSAEKQSVTGE